MEKEILRKIKDLILELKGEKKEIGGAAIYETDDFEQVQRLSRMHSKGITITYCDRKHDAPKTLTYIDERGIEHTKCR